MLEKILFINSCVRENSRTMVLAGKVLEKMSGEIKEINLEKENIMPLTRESLKNRDILISERMLDDPMFCYARELAEADRIVIAAPFWDLGFPSLLKIYLEAVMVSGIVFEYENGIPKGLCRAKSLKYVTTSGGPIFEDFGYKYIKSLAKNFFGISEVSCCRAENLDAEEIAACELMSKAKIIEID